MTRNITLKIQLKFCGTAPEIFLTILFKLKSMEILTGRQSINKQQLLSCRGKVVVGTLLQLLMEHGHFI